MSLNPEAPVARRVQTAEIMLDSLVDEVIQLDESGRVLTWNRGAERLKGYTAGEAVGLHISAFYTDEDVRVGLPERELRVTGEIGKYETEGWRTRKDGSRFWANVVLTAMRDVDGSLLGFVKVSRDQTERRAAEELIRRQRDEILELSTPVIQVWDRVLALPIIGTLDSSRATRLTESLLDKIADLQAEIVILDISGVPTIDTQVAQHLLKTVHAARLMGAASILSGVRPETAQAMVHLGIELGALRSRNTLRDALQHAMSGAVPIMRIGSNVLISLQGDLDDSTVVSIESAIMREVSRSRTTGTLIDVSGLAMVDSFIARVIARMAAMTRLLGAETVIVGIQPAVAITLVEMGVSMVDLHTALNAEQGIAMLQRLREGAGAPSGEAAMSTPVVR